MLATTLGILLLSSQSLLGFHGHHGKSKGDCDRCGAENSEVIREIVRLQRSWRWQERDDAAEELRDFDWRCHPEAVGALVFALLNDRNEEVREEAAESLAKMAPCLPEAHMALSRAATCDPDHATRKWAKKGLKALGKRCEGACKVCGPDAIGDGLPSPPESGIVLPPEPGAGLPGPGLAPGDVVVPPGEPELQPIPSSGIEVIPQSELPAIPPGPSPFTRTDKPATPAQATTALRPRSRVVPFSFIRQTKLTDRRKARDADDDDDDDD